MMKFVTAFAFDACDDDDDGDAVGVAAAVVVAVDIVDVYDADVAVVTTWTVRTPSMMT